MWSLPGPVYVPLGVVPLVRVHGRSALGAFDQPQKSCENSQSKTRDRPLPGAAISTATAAVRRARVLKRPLSILAAVVSTARLIRLSR